MADLKLRLGKDMLVMSTSFDQTLATHGFDPQDDRDYVVLCEPEVLEEEFGFEDMVGTPCFVLPTEGITQARLAHARFDGQAEKLAASAMVQANAYHPQHIVAAIGPCGLALDESSAASLRQSRDQYRDAARVLGEFPIDAIWLSGFTDGFDAQCALMGVRAVYDGVVMISFAVDDAYGLPSGSHTLQQAAALAQEYEADVVGVTTDAPVSVILEQVAQLEAGCAVPLLVEFSVKERLKRMLNAPADNPYYSPDALVDPALVLWESGVQFMRAGGMATPPYTGALMATVNGLDVKGGLV